LGVIEKDSQGKLKWIGGNKKIVFHGDILADRQTQGINVLLQINELAKQAEQDGGNIDVLAGNHDDFLISFLMGKEAAGGGDVLASCSHEGSNGVPQGVGLLELCQFGSDSLKKVDLDNFQSLSKDQKESVWKQLNAERKQILENMRRDPKGKDLLEAICRMSLLAVHDDSLFCHTDPTTQMYKVFLGDGKRPINETAKVINSFYQDGLRAQLLEGKDVLDGFDWLRYTFLDTNNRDSFLADATSMQDRAERMEKIRNLGINAIVHGHSPYYPGLLSYKDPLLIISTDMGAMRDAHSRNERSVLKIEKNGNINAGKRFDSIRT
jgi:hypothetical protein